MKIKGFGVNTMVIISFYEVRSWRREISRDFEKNSKIYDFSKFNFLNFQNFEK